MKKMFGLVSAGFFGLVALQGCVATSGDGSEQIGSASEAATACYTNSGLNPTKAALAVAMADELGRWVPDKDLARVNGGAATQYNYIVVLSGNAVCLKNNCANTRALLGQQDDRLMSFIDQNVFNPAVFRNDLSASLERAQTMISDLSRNNPGTLPPAHKLTRVGGPIDLGLGACGPHYVYQADHLDGSPLTSTEASNLGKALCTYGFGSCGSNPFIAYTLTGQGCPAGRTCIAVDPADGDNGTSTTTTAGSAPTYPMNRVYNPDNSLLNTACTTTSGKVTKLSSRCSTVPATCGYLYCS
ncbi:MAG TPA: hypothetical protein VER11_08935 [Polyangiaceae bacterium]|nr:hypothetical protein [Polyangiaceae bacterium]